MQVIVIYRETVSSVVSLAHYLCCVIGGCDCVCISICYGQYLM